MKISENIVRFFERQNFVIISTMDVNDRIHCSAKGLAGMSKEGRLWIVDLYSGQTQKNIKRDPRVSVTAIDEHKFIGYTLQGQAKIIPKEEIPEALLEAWEKRLIRRVSQRVVKSVQAEKKSPRHFEAALPPAVQYIMVFDLENIIDLSPPAMRKG